MVQMQLKLEVEERAPSGARAGLRAVAICGLAFLGILVLIVLLGGVAEADTPVSGPIATDTTWDQAMSPIWVEGDVSIQSGATLTIEPGVEVRFNGPYELIVLDGNLAADGTSASPILFTSNQTVPARGDWEAIVVQGAGPTSVLDQVIIEYASVGVQMMGSSLPVTDSEIREMQAYGVWVQSATIPAYDVLVGGSRIHNTTSNAIRVDTLSDVDLILDIVDTDFRDYGTAALLFGSFFDANASISVVGSSFNASTRAVSILGSFSTSTDAGDTFGFEFRDNWLVSDFDSYGVYVQGSILNFQQTSLAFEGNQFLAAGARDYAVYFMSSVSFSDTAVPSSLTLTLTNNTMQDLDFDAFHMADPVSGFRDVSVEISDSAFVNTPSGSTFYGAYFAGAPTYASDDYDNTLSILIERNTFVDLGADGVRFHTSSVPAGFRHVVIRVLDNDFVKERPGFNWGVYFYNAPRYDTDTFASTYDFTFAGNAASNLEADAFRVNVGTTDGFRDVSVVVTGNVIDNAGGASVVLQPFRFDADSVSSTFQLLVRDNVMEDLGDEGVHFGGSIHGFRHVSVDVTGNDFGNVVSTNMDVGLDLPSVSHPEPSYPTSLDLTVVDNTLTDLWNSGLYFNSWYGYRNVTLTVTGNLARNVQSNYMDTGIYFEGISYPSEAQDANLAVNVSDNALLDLDDYGIYFPTATGIEGYRHVDVLIEGNAFRNTQDRWMNYGVFFQSFSYTTAYPGTFDFVATSNEFQDLASRDLYLNYVDDFAEATLTVAGNTFSGSSTGFYLANGVTDARNLSFAFRNNVASNVGNYVLFADDFEGLGVTVSSATFAVEGNTVTNAYSAFYLGWVSDYDLSGTIRVENNVLTGIMENGIYLGWHARTNSRVIVRANTITGPADPAVYLDGFEEQTAQVDVVDNVIQGADQGVYVNYPAYDGAVTSLRIAGNNVSQVSTYGIYINEVWNAIAFIDIEDNVVSGDGFMAADLIYFDEGGGWYKAIVDIDVVGNTVSDGRHAVYFHGTDGYGATVLLDIERLAASSTQYGLYLDAPVGHSSDAMRVGLRGSTFQDTYRGLLYLNQVGNGLLLVDVETTEVTNFGGWGGFAFTMVENLGGFVQVDVRTSTFVPAASSLGDVFAGSGPVTMNFHFIDTVRRGVVSEADQVVRVFWEVDVVVLVGSSLDTPAGAGILVTATDQFGNQAFTASTDASGTVKGRLVTGLLIARPGGSLFAGTLTHTFVAQMGPFTGSAVGTFSANGTVTILLPGDNDADGIHDAADPDDDNDGTLDTRDAFPFDPNEQRDSDGDGIGDNADGDRDGDGVPNDLDAFPDNPLEWADADGDGIGDNADPDDDNDGVADVDDAFPTDAARAQLPSVGPDYTAPLWVLLGLLGLLIVGVVFRPVWERLLDRKE